VNPASAAQPNRVDATETAETEVVIHTVDQLHTAVQEWLEAFVTANPSRRPWTR